MQPSRHASTPHRDDGRGATPRGRALRWLQRAGCLLVGLFATQTQAQLAVPENQCQGAASGVYEIGSGIFSPASGGLTSPGGHPDFVKVSADGTGGYAIRLYTQKDGKPRWYYTERFTLSVGAASVPLYRRVREAGNEYLGKATSPGLLSLRARQGRLDQFSLAYKLVSGDRTTKTACFDMVSATPQRAASFAPLDADWQELRTSEGLAVHTGNTRSVVLLEHFTQAGEATWLKAEQPSLLAAGTLSLSYLSGTGSPLTTSAGSITINQFTTNGADYTVALSGNPLTLPSGDVLESNAEMDQWVRPRTAAAAQLTVTPQCRFSNGTTVGINNHQATSGSPLATVCAVQVSWDMGSAPVGSKLVRIAQMPGYIGYTGQLSAARSGTLTDSVTPGQKYIYAISRPADPGAAFGVLELSANPLQIVAENSNSQLAGALQIPQSAQCQAYGSGAAFTNILSPGRWRDPRLVTPSQGAADDQAIQGSPSWDVERNGSLIRLTVHTYDHDNRPVWLRTEWLPASGESTFYGILRRYHWHAATRSMTAGEPVGDVVMFGAQSQMQTGTDRYAQLLIGWRWLAAYRAAGAQNFAGSECLISEQTLVTAGRENDPELQRMIFNGVVAPWPGQDSLHNDSYSMLFKPKLTAQGSGQNRVVYQEQMIARVFDTQGRPVWLGTARHQPVFTVGAGCGFGGPSWCFPGQTIEATPVAMHVSPHQGTPKVAPFPATAACRNNHCYTDSREYGQIHRYFWSNFSAAQTMNIKVALHQPVPLSTPGGTLPAVEWRRPSAQLELDPYSETVPITHGTELPKNVVLSNFLGDRGLGSTDSSVINAFPNFCLLPQPGAGNPQGMGCPIRLSWTGGTAMAANQWRVVKRAEGGGDEVMWASGASNPYGRGALTTGNTATVFDGHFVLQRLNGNGWEDAARSQTARIARPILNEIPLDLQLAEPGPFDLGESIPLVLTRRYEYSEQTTYAFTTNCPEGPKPQFQLQPGNFTSIQVQATGCSGIGQAYVSAQGCTNFQCGPVKTLGPIQIGSGAPSAPVGLQAAVNDLTGEVTLTWSAGQVMPVDGYYRVLRAAHQATEFSDDPPLVSVMPSPSTNRSPGYGRWRYAVVACRQNACSNPGNEVDVVILAPSITAYMGTTGLGYSLQWQHVLAGIGGAYEVGVGQHPEGDDRIIAATALANAAYAGTVSGPGSWYLWVRACWTETNCSSWRRSNHYLTLPVTVANTDWSDNDVAVAPAPAPVVDVPSPAEPIEVGTLAGEFRVDESGQATYAIPLYLAPMPGQMSPELALHYSSAGAEGVLGQGFSLSGLSSVSRCRKSVESGDGPGPHPTIGFTDNDGFCLDGQRLVEMGMEGSDRRYRTEIDGLANIYRKTDGTWEVWAKDGVRRIYGETATQSRVPRNQRTVVGGAVVWEASSDTMAWNLSRIVGRDAAGSQLRFSYTTDGSSGESRLVSVDSGGAGPRLELDYVARPQGTESVRYMAGARMLSTVLLSGIRSLNTEGETLRHYVIRYAPRGEGVSFDSGPQRVVGITETKQGLQGPRYPETVFGWSTTGNGMGGEDRQGGTPFAGMLAHKYGDINGDGVTDIVWVKLDGNGGDLMLNTASLVEVQVGAVTKTNVRYDTPRCAADGLNIPDCRGPYIRDSGLAKGWQLFDYNQDGRDDLLYLNVVKYGTINGDRFDAEWKALLSNGSYFQTEVAVSNLPEYVGITKDTLNIISDAVMADFDGNGLIDLIAPAPGAGGAIKLNLYRQVASQASIACSVNGVSASCPYEFASAQVLQFGNDLSGGTLSLRKDAVEDMSVFDADGDGLADLLLHVDCGGNPGCVNPAMRTTLNSDYAVATLDNETPAAMGEAPSGGEYKYWVLFTHDYIQPATAASSFRSYETWQTKGEGSTVADYVEGRRDDQLFRMVDLNGDSLADVFYRPYVSGPGGGVASSRHFQLNTGNGFSAPECVKMPNSEEAGSGLCAVFDQAEDDSLEIADFNGDGKMDLWVGLFCTDGRCSGNGERSSPPLDPIQVFCSGYGDESDPYYGVLLWGKESFDGGEVCSGAGNPSREGWTRAFVDLDGNTIADHLWIATGSSTILGGDGQCDGAGCYVIQRDVAGIRPRNMINQITNGYGMQTRIQYAPMSFSSVYRRDYNGPYVNQSAAAQFGRGSPVMDIGAAGQFLVQMVESSAPALGAEADPWARVGYRYAGAKIQTGGRGPLGMRKVWSMDLQTQIETETEYYQAWPLTGTPKATRSRLLSTPYHFGNCGMGPGASVDRILPGCLAAAPLCQTAGVSNPSVTCDSTAPAGSWLLSQADDAWTWRKRTGVSTLHATAGTLDQNVPNSVFIYQKSSIKYSAELSTAYPPTVSLVKTEVSTTEGVDPTDAVLPGYDGNGNVLQSSVVTRSNTNAVLQRVHSTFAYAPTVPIDTRWVSGLLTSSTVVTTRGGISKSRTTEFVYDDRGMVKIERIQPQSTSLGERLNIHTVRNSQGLPILKISCSGDFSDTACASHTIVGGVAVPNGFVMDPLDSLQVRRYESFVYDPLGRFVDTTYGHVDNSTAANSAGVQIATQHVSSRSAYGAPVDVRDANGVWTRSLYTPMGRLYQSYVKGFNQTVAPIGSNQVSRTDWCSAYAPAGTTGVTCPVGAVYRSQVQTQGAPLARTYHDMLDREILGETQAFSGSGWNAVAKGYDKLGRTIQTSEPYAVASAGGADRRLCTGTASTTVCTQQHYDALGRNVLTYHPDHTSARPVITTAHYAAEICPVEGLSIMCYVKAITNPEEQVSTEITGPLGQIALARDYQGLELRYGYDAHGNLTSVQRFNGGIPLLNAQGQPIQNTAIFDDLGRRTSMQDTDTGTRTTTYNAAGEVTREVSANQHCTTSRYDSAARLIQRNDFTTAGCIGNAQSQSVWQYDTVRYGALTSEAETISNVQRSFAYDQWSRPVSTVTTMGGETYPQEQTYDAYGRPFQTLDLIFGAGSPHSTSSGARRALGVQYSYNGNGHQDRILNAQDPADVFYEVLQVNARGQVVEDRRGNKVELSRQLSFDTASGRLLGIRSGINGSLQDLDYDGSAVGLLNGYDRNGNLLSRHDARTGMAEYYGYDGMNRLVAVDTYSNGSAVPGLYSLNSYDLLGNFQSKGGVAHTSGSYAAGAPVCSRTNVGPHMVTRAVSSTLTHDYCYDANGNQILDRYGAWSRQIAYTVHDKPSQILVSDAAGTHYTRYEYGPNREITRRLEGPNLVSVTEQTHYIGGVEVTYRQDAGLVSEAREYRRHLANYLIVKLQAQKVSGVWQRTSGRQYRFEDKLGSIDVLASESGAVLERMSFDVWGQRRDASGWVSADSQAVVGGVYSQVTRKGYTGHEQVDRAQLIHMGGRIYDPFLGRFLSADPLVQAPTDTQSYNRYTYVLNNPMNYVDPSGYSWIKDNWRTVLAIAVTAFAPQVWGLGAFKFSAMSLGQVVATGMVTGAIQTGSLRGMLVGGLSAAMFHGIGELHAAGKLKDFGKLAAHATAGGVISVLNGGKFGHGFASAGFVEAMSPVIGSMPNVETEFLAAVVVGGTASRIAGGKFGNGAVTAAMQWGFNRLSHESGDGADTTAPRTSEELLLDMFGQGELRRSMGIEKYWTYVKMSKACSNEALLGVAEGLIPGWGAIQGWWEGDSVQIVENVAATGAFVGGVLSKTGTKKAQELLERHRRNWRPPTRTAREQARLLTAGAMVAKNGSSWLGAVAKKAGLVGAAFAVYDYSRDYSKCMEGFR